MLKVLSKEESFHALERNFSELTEYDIIDLCHEDERFPAVVVSVDYAGRSFEAVRLTKTLMVSLMSGSVSPAPIPTITVSIPPEPSERHPGWNVVGK